MALSTRRTQPYRRGPRQPGGALTAMLRGKTASDQHPKDALRLLQRNARKRPRRRRRRR